MGQRFKNVHNLSKIDLSAQSALLSRMQSLDLMPIPMVCIMSFPIIFARLAHPVAEKQARGHPPLVWCVGKVPCGKDHRLPSCNGTVD